MDRYLGGEHIDVEILDRPTWRRPSPAASFYPVLGTAGGAPAGSGRASCSS